MRPSGSDWLVDRGYAAGWRLVRALPQTAAGRLFRAGADLAARRPGPGAGQLRRNLARVVPTASEAELDVLVRDALRSYARYWCEAFRLPSMDLDALYRQVGPHIAGQHHLSAAFEEGRGAILALPHAGNWDIAGAWLVRHCGQFTTVAERLQPESLFRRFVAYRESLGFEILPLTGGEAPPSTLLAERLRANRLVCLIADRQLGGAGVPVEFFGEQARLPGGPAHLAASTGAALLPVGSWFTEDGWGFRVHPRIPVPDRRAIRKATQALADAFASDIAGHPEDWHMLQKVWTADVEQGRAG
jgi:lauroyl/myristoyl acyltransferase